MTKHRRLIPLALVLLGSITQPLHAEPGDIDRSFGRLGIAQPIRLHEETLVIQAQPGPHGTTVVLGFACGRTPECAPFLARYRRDGLLDKTFGTRGVIRVYGFRYYPDTLHVADDGSVFVSEKSRILKITHAGKPDPTFGRKGVVRLENLPPRDGTADVFDLTTQPDGAVLIAIDHVSWRAPVNQDLDLLTGPVLRLDPTGAVDTTFGYNGFGPVGIGTDRFDVELFPDGRIGLAAQYNHPDEHGYEVYVVTPQGTLDPTFGRAGHIRTPTARLLDDILDFSIDDDGAPMLTARQGNDTMLIARFGMQNDFVEQVVKGPKNMNLNEAVFDRAGRVYATYSFGPSWSPQVRRYGRSGLDRTFGASGRVDLDDHFGWTTTRAVPLSQGAAVVGSIDEWVSAIRLK